MVRFLHLRFSCGFPCARVFPVKNTRNVAHSLSRDLCGRLCRKALRSPCLWEIGRQDRPKYAFLLTITIMGSATTIIGLLPSYQTIGLLAPAILHFIRMLQGLALGGEYGGAAIYVAELAPDEKRGYWTIYI